jgi:hypothetical protein
VFVAVASAPRLGHAQVDVQQARPAEDVDLAAVAREVARHLALHASKQKQRRRKRKQEDQESRQRQRAGDRKVMEVGADCQQSGGDGRPGRKLEDGDAQLPQQNIRRLEPNKQRKRGERCGGRPDKRFHGSRL